MSIAKAIESSIEQASWIRQMFEKGQELRELHGAENVFDFSLGNPVLEPPPQWKQTLIQLLEESPPGQHRYMPNGGFPETKQYIATSLKEETQLPFEANDITMSVGAGGALNVTFKALLDPGDEVMVFAPYFVEYGSYARNHGGTLVVVPTTNQFQPDFEQILQALSPKTKIILINSPNNPTGVVYSQETINMLGELIAQKEKEYGHSIYLISDEPYRHLLFDDAQPSYVFHAHQNSLLITSHSKDLGLAGERIGYTSIHPNIQERELVQQALVYTTRILGFVNAPALMQRTLPYLQNAKVDINVYKQSRDLLVPELSQMGFDVVQPQGAFYVFPKSPIPDDIAFVQQAQEYQILLVPGTGFGCPGYFRLAFCCEVSTIERALPQLRQLAKATIR